MQVIILAQLLFGILFHVFGPSIGNNTSGSRQTQCHPRNASSMCLAVHQCISCSCNQFKAAKYTLSEPFCNEIIGINQTCGHTDRTHWCDHEIIAGEGCVCPGTFNELRAEDPTPIEDITETHQAFKHTGRTRFEHGEIWCVCPANAHLPACRRYGPVRLFKLNGHSFGMSPQEIDCAMPEWPGNPRDLYETFRARFPSYMGGTITFKINDKAKRRSRLAKKPRLVFKCKCGVNNKGKAITVTGWFKQADTDEAIFKALLEQAEPHRACVHVSVSPSAPCTPANQQRRRSNDTPLPPALSNLDGGASETTLERFPVQTSHGTFPAENSTNNRAARAEMHSEHKREMRQDIKLETDPELAVKRRNAGRLGRLERRNKRLKHANTSKAGHSGKAKFDGNLNWPVNPHAFICL